MIKMFKITQGGIGSALFVHDESEVGDALFSWASDSEEVYHVQRVLLSKREYDEIMANDFDGF